MPPRGLHRVCIGSLSISSTSATSISGLRDGDERAETVADALWPSDAAGLSATFSVPFRGEAAPSLDWTVPEDVH